MNTIITRFTILLLAGLVTACSETGVVCNDDFAREFETALENKDIKKVMSMHHLEGVGGPVKTMTKLRMAGVSARSISRIDVREVPAEAAEKRQPLNLTPKKALVVHFNGAGVASESSETMTLMLGEHEGSCRIAVAALRRQ